MEVMGIFHEDQSMEVVDGNRRARFLSSVSIISMNVDSVRTSSYSEATGSVRQNSRPL